MILLIIQESSFLQSSHLWLCFSSSLMKSVLNFMRNPKLAHILVTIQGGNKMIFSPHPNLRIFLLCIEILTKG